MPRSAACSSTRAQLPLSGPSGSYTAASQRHASPARRRRCKTPRRGRKVRSDALAAFVLSMLRMSCILKGQLAWHCVLRHNVLLQSVHDIVKAMSIVHLSMMRCLHVHGALCSAGASMLQTATHITAERQHSPRQATASNLCPRNCFVMAPRTMGTGVAVWEARGSCQSRLAGKQLPPCIGTFFI